VGRLIEVAVRTVVPGHGLKGVVTDHRTHIRPGLLAAVTGAAEIVVQQSRGEPVIEHRGGGGSTHPGATAWMVHDVPHGAGPDLGLKMGGTGRGWSGSWNGRS
jgi:hypothetical protein